MTFFFNGGVERQFENEERCLVPSPKVATYDLLPPMSSAGVADKVRNIIVLIYLFPGLDIFDKVYRLGCQKVNDQSHELQ